MADNLNDDQGVVVSTRGVMGRERNYVNRLIEILQADNHYFTVSRQLAIRKVRGIVDDAFVQSVNDAYERAMDLREAFTADHGGLFDQRVSIEPR